MKARKTIPTKNFTAIISNIGENVTYAISHGHFFSHSKPVACAPDYKFKIGKFFN